MAITLAKGGNVDLTKEAGGVLTSIRIGLGWDLPKTSGVEFDLDASIVGLADNGLSAGEDWFVFYNRLQSPGAEIVHQGDERTGATAGDDEQIVIDLSRLPEHITELVVAVTIHEAATRSQNFGLVDNAYVRVVDETTGTELARYDLSEDGSTLDTMVFGKAYRKDGAWKFKALGGDGFSGGLQGIVDAYKVA